MMKAYRKEFTSNREHKNFATMENLDLLQNAVGSVRDKLKSDQIDDKEAAILVYNAIGYELNPEWKPVK